MKSRKTLGWLTYTVRVTLVPCAVRPAEYKEATAIIETVTVEALTDHMAGTLASKVCEDHYDHYQAVYYEIVGKI